MLPRPPPPTSLALQQQQVKDWSVGGSVPPPTEPPPLPVFLIYLSYQAISSSFLELSFYESPQWLKGSQLLIIKMALQSNFLNGDSLTWKCRQDTKS